MANIKVRILNDTTLILEENASKGDTIDLTSVQSVDLNYINKVVNSASFNSYKEQILSEFKVKEEKLNNEHNNKLERLNQIIKDYDTNKKLEIDNITSKLESSKAQEISGLKLELSNKLRDFDNKRNQEISELKLAQEQALNSLRLQYERARNQETISLNDKIKELTEKINSFEKEKENIRLANELETNKVVSNIKEKFSKEKDELEQKLSRLTLEKSSLNIKMLGEELEKWCNEEFESYAQAGFINTTWEKDNSSVKDEDDIKGTKADYIFRAYFDSDKTIELSSVCCEMKNESITSVNKKKNQDHYAKLDKDRQKKNCEYALLISELEWDSANDAPIKKVRDYDKMYVVRPQYFITFLSLISSLSNKYKDLISEKQTEAINLKTSIEIQTEFEELKSTYLEKPLDSLSSRINDIMTASESITKANQKIKDTCYEITAKTIDNMRTKINNFKIQKIVKTLKKIED